jgi:uncharacterized cupredoxin-like copper-binding protein
MKLKVIKLFVFAGFIAFAGMAIAAGNHPDGSGHDDHNGIGKPGISSMVDRTVIIDMKDGMRFVPEHLTVKRDETIRFLVKNSDEIEHEFVLGTTDELKEHSELMKKFPEMEHDDPNQVRVAPGQVGEIIWQFSKPGRLAFACLIPGHYEAGMKGTVSVAKDRAQNQAEKR